MSCETFLLKVYSRMNCTKYEPRAMLYRSHILYISIGVAPIAQLRACVTKIVHIQRRSPNIVSDFPYHKGLLLKERIRSLWEQILSFKIHSNFKKGCD